MYSEIKVQTKQNVPKNLKASLEEHFGSSEDVVTTIDLTCFSGSHDFVDRIVYAYVNGNRVFLVFEDDVNTLRFHIENIQDKDKIDTLKLHISDTFSQIRSYSKRKKLRIKNAKSQIYSESSHIITGVYYTKIQSLSKIFKDDLFTKIYIPVVTFMLSLMMNYDLEKSIFNVLVAVGATFLLLFYKAISSDDELHYTSTL